MGLGSWYATPRAERSAGGESRCTSDRLSWGHFAPTLITLEERR